MADAETIEGLWHYLREISISARSLVIRELERSVLCTEEIVGVDLVLNELRNTMRERLAGAASVGATPITNIPVVSRAALCSPEALWTRVRRDLFYSPIRPSR